MPLSTTVIGMTAVLANLPTPAKPHPICSADLVVVGRLRKTAAPVPVASPEHILGRSVYRYEVAVERALVGVPPPSLSFSEMLHVGFNPDILAPILFFDTSQTEPRLVEFEYHAIRDRSGRLVIPLLGSTPRADWLPRNFANYSRPVRYAASALWWMGAVDLRIALEERKERGWVGRRNGRIVLLRGLYEDDIPRLLRDRQADCAS